MDLKVGGPPVTLVAAGFDAKGNEVKQAFTWVVSDTNILGITVAADGLSADIVAAGAIGSATVTASLASVSSDPFALNGVAGDVVRIVLTVRA